MKDEEALFLELESALTAYLKAPAHSPRRVLRLARAVLRSRRVALAAPSIVVLVFGLMRSGRAQPAEELARSLAELDPDKTHLELLARVLRSRGKEADAREIERGIHMARDGYKKAADDVRRARRALKI